MPTEIDFNHTFCRFGFFSGHFRGRDRDCDDFSFPFCWQFFFGFVDLIFVLLSEFESSKFRNLEKHKKCIYEQKTPENEIKNKKKSS